MSQAAEGPKRLFFTKVTENRTTDVEGIGTIRQEGDKWYRWIKNADATALVAGQPIVYLITNGEAFHEQVDSPITANLNTYGGTVMSAIPTLNFGWIQIEGYHASNIVSIGKTSIAAGINCRPADTVAYLVGGAAQSATVASVSNQMVGRLQLAASIASSSASAGGTDAGTTAVGGFIHCLTV